MKFQLLIKTKMLKNKIFSCSVKSKQNIVFILLIIFFVLFDLILYVPVNNVSEISQNGSSWVKPVLSKDKCVLLKAAT